MGSYVDFAAPSFRGSAQDLTVQISPLGLVELSDEEFEVHGPRMNRYSINWAMYLGHHWSYRREVGEQQSTYNYYKAFTDYKVRFTFGHGVQFSSPKETDAIVPDLLKRVWEVDNDKMKVLFEMGTNGAVSGDSFIKVAYEEPYEDSIGRVHPGRVRLLPLNSAYCMPVEDTEILTRRGWLSAHELTTDDQVMSLDPETDEMVWADVQGINLFDWDGPMHRWENNGFSALSTPDHRWVFQKGRKKGGAMDIRTSAELQDRSSGSIVLAGGILSHFPEIPTHANEFVELVGWAVTEGWRSKGGYWEIGQSVDANPMFCERIEKLAQHYRNEGFEVSRRSGSGADHWYIPAALSRTIDGVLTEGRGLSAEFLTSLTLEQATLLYNTLLDGDGDTARSGGGRERLYQKHQAVIDSFQMLAMMLGKRSVSRVQKVSRNKFGDTDGTVSVHRSRTAQLKWMDREVVHYTGQVWCPTTSTGTWVVRRKEVIPPGAENEDRGSMFRQTVYLTGNCFPE